MDDNLTITEDALTDLSILRKKIAVVLDCVIDETDARNQTLTYIATDYLAMMGTQLRTMQEDLLRGVAVINEGLAKCTDGTSAAPTL